MDIVGGLSHRTSIIQKESDPSHPQAVSLDGFGAGGARADYGAVPADVTLVGFAGGNSVNLPGGAAL